MPQAQVQSVIRQATQAVLHRDPHIWDTSDNLCPKYNRAGTPKAKKPQPCLESRNSDMEDSCWQERETTERHMPHGRHQEWARLLVPGPSGQRLDMRFSVQSQLSNLKGRKLEADRAVSHSEADSLPIRLNENICDTFLLHPGSSGLLPFLF